MNNYAETERVIDLKDLLYTAAKKWRAIVVGAIIIGLLAGLYQAVAGLLVRFDSEALAEAQEKYEIALEDHNATGERLRTNIANLREQSVRQREYNTKSELMKIDPMNKWDGTLQLYIDAMYQINPSMTFQNTDLTNRFVWAYVSYLQSGEFYNEILKTIDSIDEIRFLTEIFDVSSNTGSAAITIHCIGKSEEDVRALLAIAQEKVQNRYEIIRDTIGDHNCSILTESVFSTVDLALDAQQKANLVAITDYANAIAEQNEELTKWEKTPEPRPEYGGMYTLKWAIKYAVVGGVIGLVVMFCWFAAKYVAGGTVKTENDWRENGFLLLGCIHRDKKKRWLPGIDSLIDRVFGRERIMTTEQECSLAAHNLEAALREQGLAEAKLVGHVDKMIAEDIVQKMETAVPDVKCAFAGDPLTDPNTANCLGQQKNAILIAENQTTCIGDLQQMMTMLKAWGKTVLGVVIIE